LELYLRREYRRAEQHAFRIARDVNLSIRDVGLFLQPERIVPGKTILEIPLAEQEQSLCGRLRFADVPTRFGKLSEDVTASGDSIPSAFSRFSFPPPAFIPHAFLLCLTPSRAAC